MNWIEDTARVCSLRVIAFFVAYIACSLRSARSFLQRKKALNRQEMNNKVRSCAINQNLMMCTYIAIDTCYFITQQCMIIRVYNVMTHLPIKYNIYT